RGNAVDPEAKAAFLTKGDALTEFPERPFDGRRRGRGVDRDSDCLTGRDSPAGGDAESGGQPGVFQELASIHATRLHPLSAGDTMISEMNRRRFLQSTTALPLLPQAFAQPKSSPAPKLAPRFADGRDWWF